MTLEVSRVGGTDTTEGVVGRGAGPLSSARRVSTREEVGCFELPIPTCGVEAPEFGRESTSLVVVAVEGATTGGLRVGEAEEAEVAAANIDIELIRLAPIPPLDVLPRPPLPPLPLEPNPLGAKPREFVVSF